MGMLSDMVSGFVRKSYDYMKKVIRHMSNQELMERLRNATNDNAREMLEEEASRRGLI